jgi:hypothetical protein
MFAAAAADRAGGLTPRLGDVPVTGRVGGVLAACSPTLPEREMVRGTTLGDCVGDLDDRPATEPYAEVWWLDAGRWETELLGSCAALRVLDGVLAAGPPLVAPPLPGEPPRPLPVFKDRELPTAR